jgi:predicted ribosome quality control (RQC) complex YloA/Tae2 family protein
MKFRQLITKKGTLLLAGKNAKNNEELIEQVQPSEIVLHTAEAGSPFVNIKGKPKFWDIKEAAIFCARHSKDWRDNKKDVLVHKFIGKDIYKDRNMKLGTFGIKKFKVIKVKKKWIEEFIKCQ